MLSDEGVEGDGSGEGTSKMGLHDGETSVPEKGILVTIGSLSAKDDGRIYCNIAINYTKRTADFNQCWCTTLELTHLFC